MITNKQSKKLPAHDSFWQLIQLLALDDLFKQTMHLDSTYMDRGWFNLANPRVVWLILKAVCDNVQIHTTSRLQYDSEGGFFLPVKPDEHLTPIEIAHAYIESGDKDYDQFIRSIASIEDITLLQEAYEVEAQFLSESCQCPENMKTWFQNRQERVEALLSMY